MRRPKRRGREDRAPEAAPFFPPLASHQIQHQQAGRSPWDSFRISSDLENSYAATSSSSILLPPATSTKMTPFSTRVGKVVRHTGSEARIAPPVSRSNLHPCSGQITEVPATMP